jgi:membrane protease YdiL (CAAX protease family)
MPDIVDPKVVLTFISAFLVASFGFIFYHLITSSKFFQTKDGNNIRQIILQRLCGVFFFGIVSIVLIRFLFSGDFASFGSAAPTANSFLWLAILALVIIPMSYLSSKSPSNLAQYPQIRVSEWSIALVILSAVSWITYLLAYEFLFRGFFLFASLPLLGLWPSILLNTAVYSLVHIPKGNKETIGAIPLGILLSYLTIQTGSFWLAFFVHVVLALSNEWFSLAFHPNMHLKKSLS